MTTITIALSEDQLVELNERAARLGVAPEDLVQVSIEELLNRPDETFAQAVDYVLTKNTDLYQRLA
jgi:hypothetical protein